MAAQGSSTVSLTYDYANRRSTVTYPNGIVATHGYDAANQVTSITYTLGQSTLGDLTYSYDAAGNRTSVGGSLARTGLPTALASATYDAANRIATWSGTSFTYDPNGNLISDGLISYLWNARNQLVGLSGATSASFQYDGLRRRESKTVGGTTTGFLYDGVNLVQELSGSTPTANLLTGSGIDETLTRTDAGGASTLLVDGLRSTLALADTSGTVQTQYTFEPFGTTTASGVTTTNAMQFTGRENDGTGLYAYRARFYSPALQRFISEDPLDVAGGLNVFAYAANAPTVYTDPSGLKPSPGFGQPPGRGPGGQGGPGAGGPNGPGGNGPSGAPSPNPNGQPPRCSGNSGGGPGAIGGTVIADPWGVGMGPAVSWAYIPTTGEWFIAPGVGASLGHNFSFGPLVGPNPSGVLPGWSFGGGYNATPWRGVQGAVNSSGALGGNSFGVPGVSATVTYGFCF